MKYKFDEELLVSPDMQGRDKMLSSLVKKHGELFYTSVGKSILSRQIDALYIGSGGRFVCIFATHHALEDVTANIAFMLADYLLSMQESGTVKGVDCKLLLSKYRFVILPCVNPDGVEMRYHGVDESPLRDRQLRMSDGDFTRWQANARGVDLNHNYDYRFREYKLLERERGIVAGGSLYSGEYPESEPEARAIASLVRALSPSLVVSLHTQGEEIYAFPNTKKIMRCAKRLADACGYMVSIPDGTAAYGGLCDYTGSLGIPSFTLELGKGENPLPTSDARKIFQRVADALLILPTLL